MENEIVLDFLEDGGLVMYPLGFCSLLALSIVIEKLINNRPSKILRTDIIDTLLDLIRRGKEQDARVLLYDRPGILALILRAAVENLHSGPVQLRQAVIDAGRQQIPHLERYLPALGTIAGIAPLLGLLGTVTGMIKVFKAIPSQEVGMTAGLASGISEALITTATGLTLAIPVLVVHQILHARSDRMLLALERIALDFVRDLLKLRKEMQSEPRREKERAGSHGESRA
jgi:biopolymer transport protein ExbB